MISVIIPVYNCGKYINTCADSILKQDFKDLEIIFVNDGSTDNSLEKILKIQKNDARIKIINKKNGGLSSARNAGLDIAKGEFVLFVDGDDRLGSKQGAYGLEITKLYNAIQNCDISVGTVDIIYESNKEMQLSDSVYYKIPWKGTKYIKNNEILEFHVSACGKLYRKSIIDKYNIRFPEGLRYEDAYWHVCYLSVANKANFIDTCVYTYYRHPSGIMFDTFNKKGLTALDHTYICEKIYIFLSKNNIFDLYFYIDMFKNYLNFSLKNSNDIYRPYIIYKAGEILRKCNINTTGDTILENVKNGNISIGSEVRTYMEDAYKWQKLKKISYKFLPKGSRIRKFILYILTKFIKKF